MHRIDSPTRRRGAASPVAVIGLVVVIVAALAGLKMVVTPPSSGDDGAWLHSIDEGLDRAGALDRPMLVLFTADWCPPCRALKRDVLTRPEVLAELEASWTLVKIDLTTPGGPGDAVAAEAGVRSIPTMLAFDAQGYRLGAYNGDRSVADFLRWTRRIAG